MKSTSIVRRVDDLSRVVIPKDIRRMLGIKEGDALEIYTIGDDLLFRKYILPAKNKAATAQEWLEQNAQTMKNLSARFSIEDRTTTCEIIKNGARETGSATARCDDTLIPSVGMVIALCRAVGWKIPQELLES